MRYSVVAATLMWVLGSAGAFAQDEEGLEAFGDVIDVRVLNLEVAVTDKDGHHVPDLGPEDFRLIIDGQEVSVDYFSEIRDGRASDGTPESAGATVAGGEVSAVPSVTPGEVVGTNFLLFVDNFFGHKRDRQLVLEDISEQVAGFGPKDKMAVVAFDGKKLDLVGNWSSSKAEIERHLLAAMEHPAYGLHRLGELQLFDRQRRVRATDVGIEDSSRHIAVEYATKLSRQVGTVVRAATTAMRTMASPPGRKVMLLTSGGWPSDPAAFVAGSDPDVRNSTRLFSPRSAFHDLAGTANLLGYTLYPIDMPGKQAAAGSDASDRGEHLAVFRAPSTTPEGPPAKSMLTPEEIAASRAEADYQHILDTFDQGSGRELEIEQSLVDLALDTGGRPMINGLRTAVLEESIRDVSNYYWLGYAPTWKRDDQAHEVRVEILRPGLDARSRRSFRDLSRSTEVTMMVESNLLFSTKLSGHSLEVEVGEAANSGRRLELPVSLKIPLDQVVMLPVQGGFEARLELRVAVMDSEGNRSEIPVIPVVLGGAERPQPGAYAVYDTSLKIRKKEQRLALALYDVAGEQILSSSIEFDPKSI